MAFSHTNTLPPKTEIYKRSYQSLDKGVRHFVCDRCCFWYHVVFFFELGLLFPKFIKHAGSFWDAIFRLEGTAFFIEAIALGFFVWLYKFNKWFHWFCGFSWD